MKSCVACLRPKASLYCESCKEPLCKDCEIFLDNTTFSYYEQIPADCSHQSYCGTCYDGKVAPALVHYNEVMERAKTIFVFYTTQKRKPRILKRSRTMISVKDRPDRDEVIMRLAFLAALQNYNAILETEIISEKVRNHGYQKSTWRGKALPIIVDESKLIPDYDG